MPSNFTMYLSFIFTVLFPLAHEELLCPSCLQLVWIKNKIVAYLMEEEANV